VDSSVLKFSEYLAAANRLGGCMGCRAQQEFGAAMRKLPRPRVPNGGGAGKGPCHHEASSALIVMASARLAARKLGGCLSPVPRAQGRAKGSPAHSSSSSRMPRAMLDACWPIKSKRPSAVCTARRGRRGMAGSSMSRNVFFT